MREALGEQTSLELTLSRRLGRPWIAIEYRGRRFNPIESAREDVFSDLLLSRLGIAPVWSHRGKVNRITFRLPSRGIRSETLLVVAVLLAVALGTAGAIVPAGVRAFATQYVLTPLSDIFMKLLSTVAPMLIFLSTLIGMAGGNGADAAKAGKYVIARYVWTTLAMAVGSALVMLPFFRFDYGALTAETSSLETLYRMLLDIVPGSIVQPFTDGNTVQIVLLAILLGSIMRMLDNRIGALLDMAQGLHMVFMNAVDFICGALPLYVFTSLLSLF